MSALCCLGSRPSSVECSCLAVCWFVVDDRWVSVLVCCLGSRPSSVECSCFWSVVDDCWQSVLVCCLGSRPSSVECSCSADNEERDWTKISSVAVHVHSVLLQSSAWLIRHSTSLLCVSFSFVLLVFLSLTSFWGVHLTHTCRKFISFQRHKTQYNHHKTFGWNEVFFSWCVWNIRIHCCVLVQVSHWCSDIQHWWTVSLGFINPCLSCTAWGIYSSLSTAAAAAAGAGTILSLCLSVCLSVCLLHS